MIKSDKKYESIITQLTDEASKNYILLSREGDVEARDKVICGNLKLVVPIARRYTGQGLGFMALITQGNRSLRCAIENFNPAEDIPFSEFAKCWIEESMVRAVAEQKPEQAIAVDNRVVLDEEKSGYDGPQSFC